MELIETGTKKKIGTKTSLICRPAENSIYTKVFEPYCVFLAK